MDRTVRLLNRIYQSKTVNNKQPAKLEKRFIRLRREEDPRKTIIIV